MDDVLTCSFRVLAGQRSAFAFVKFDNTVSPARAVREEVGELSDASHSLY